MNFDCVARLSDDLVRAFCLLLAFVSTTGSSFFPPREHQCHFSKELCSTSSLKSRTMRLRRSPDCLKASNLKEERHHPNACLHPNPFVGLTSFYEKGNSLYLHALSNPPYVQQSFEGWYSPPSTYFLGKVTSCWQSSF